MLNKLNNTGIFSLAKLMKLSNAFTMLFYNTYLKTSVSSYIYLIYMLNEKF